MNKELKDGTTADSSTTAQVTTSSQPCTKPLVRRSLPLTNADLWAMAERITEVIKKAYEMPPKELDKWSVNQVEGDWFDWLEEKLMGNDA